MEAFEFLFKCEGTQAGAAKSMSALTVYSEHDLSQPKTYTQVEAIARCLEEIGARLEQWEAQAPLTAKAPQEEIIGTYQNSVDRLCQEEGFKSVDVISIKPDHPKKRALREKFLFAKGQRQFYLHKVYALLCGQGGLTQRARMGGKPRLELYPPFHHTPRGGALILPVIALLSAFPG